MSTQAAMTAQKYSRRFWSRLKPKLRIWDFIMGLLTAAFTPYVQHLLSDTKEWWTYVFAAVITYVVFLVLYVLAKSVLLLVERDKQLEVAQVTIPALQKRLQDWKKASLEQQLRQGEFLWQYRQNRANTWENAIYPWHRGTVNALAVYTGDDYDVAERKLLAGMNTVGQGDEAVLKMKIDYLTSLIGPTSSS